MPDAVRAAGQRALLADFSTPAEVLAFHRQLTAKPLAGQVEVVPAARTVLIVFRTRNHTREAARQLRRVRTRPGGVGEGREVEIRVQYDGADLDKLAELLGMSSQGLIDWHSSTRWVGGFAGFAPGFTYCLPEAVATRRRLRKSEQPFQVPRLSSPRTEVPEGSVALAGEFSAVYPRSSPGGWQLIGTTDAVMWDLDRPEPVLIQPGDAVRYVPVSDQITLSAAAPSAARRRYVPAGDAVVDVLHPGPQTLLQDLGRPGRSGLGVPRSGAADVQALRQANELVGNDDSAAGFEVLYGGFELAVRQISVLAVTGAETSLQVATPTAPETSNMAVSGTGADKPSGGSTQVSERVRDVPLRAPFLMYPGERLRLGVPERGIRSYVAFSGGLAADRVLGSAATDVLSGLGPAPVASGDTFALVGVPSGFVGIADVARTALPEVGQPTRLRFVVGPRDEWFAGRHGNPGLDALTSLPWTVSRDSNRIGLRLSAGEEAPTPAIERTRPEELPSEAVVRGAIQVPGSGEPVLFLADHPVTGGYPVIGVVVREDLGLAAQLPPGAEVSFQAVDPDTLEPA
ncbi:5-oxoprolinase subunit B/C family protein [Nesterenkonia haasae]|uniref:5-oxoprolinase subunit B/C family protein n=1 Tax=Nesterenkonia haasae TaxID=2587813 RepID=UPI001391302B|nr:urea amidolyase family protein [Nesterenkonia haasae]NDK32193.1 5-oxoprolinase/urea amidolyase family protein [Nesterenkonia haasae]